MTVRITVTCLCGHVVGTYFDRIEEKYPFFCEACDDTCSGKYPWELTTKVVEAA